MDVYICDKDIKFTELKYKNYTTKEIDQTFDLNILEDIICNPNYDIRQRISVLFQLRSIANFGCIKVLEKALLAEPESDLLRHEICYVFGQMLSTEENINEIENFLNREIFDKPDKWASIVLHEAAEALGNICNNNNVELLNKFSKYEDEIIKETCLLSLENVKWLNETNKGQTEGLNHESDCKMYNTNDPAPPFNYVKYKEYSDLNNLRKILNEDNLFNQYRVLFTLRNIGTKEAVDIMCECFSDKFTALFKHEVAFVLGQMAKTAKNALLKLEIVLQDENESSIVRHETALALGEISESRELLEKYTSHKDKLVAESCIIATEFIEYWNEFKGDCC